MIIVCQTLLKNTKINGIALFPFIVLRNPQDRRNKRLINHESIHLRQQVEMFLVFFYVWYLIEYYYWLFKLKNPREAYLRISFEREAYVNEHNMDYLAHRKWYAFFKYIKN